MNCINFTCVRLRVTEEGKRLADFFFYIAGFGKPVRDWRVPNHHGEEGKRKKFGRGRSWASVSGCYMGVVADVSTGGATQQHATGPAHHWTAGHGSYTLQQDLCCLYTPRPVWKWHTEVSRLIPAEPTLFCPLLLWLEKQLQRTHLAWSLASRAMENDLWLNSRKNNPRENWFHAFKLDKQSALLTSLYGGICPPPPLFFFFFFVPWLWYFFWWSLKITPWIVSSWMWFGCVSDMLMFGSVSGCTSVLQL